MSILIETIYLKINFNIPTITDTTLTRNLFYFPSEETTTAKSTGGSLTKYPFFTFDVKYPTSELKSMTRSEQINFFFDKELFKNTLEKFPIATTASQRFDNGNYNVMCMLGCMFPTSFPIPSNVQNSFETKIEKKTNNDDDFDFSKDGTVFSYIRINGSVYTVVKSLWINDIINNNTFNVLLTKLNEYNDWENSQKIKLLNEIDKQKRKLMKKRDIFFKTYKSPDNVLSELTDFTKETSSSRSSRYALENQKVRRLLPEIRSQFALLYSNSADIDKVISLSVQIKKLLNKIPTYSDFIPGEFYSVASYSKNIYSDKIVLYAIEHPEFIKRANKETKETLNKYKNVNQIVASIQEFSSPKLNSSNSELQNLIDNFIKTKDSESKNIKSFAQYVRNLYVKKNKNFIASYSSDLLNIGVAISKIPDETKEGSEKKPRRLDSQLQIDVFKGIIKKDNLKCVHRNAYLEKLYDALKFNTASDTSELDKVRPYLDFDSISTQTKKGGKSRKNKNTKYNITRKNRF
jgi:hypothetical protein